jgi:hypothetical protein
MSSPDRFKYVEDEYFRLKGQLAVGRITQPQYEAALSALMIEDAQGRHWMLGVDSGEWHVYDGSAWIKADPYAAQAKAIPSVPMDLPELGTRREHASAAPPSAITPAPQPQQTATQPTKSSGGCGGCLVKGCLILVILLVLVGGVGFLGIQSGVLTTDRLLDLVGRAFQLSVDR